MSARALGLLIAIAALIFSLGPVPYASAAGAPSLAAAVSTYDSHDHAAGWTYPMTERGPVMGDANITYDAVDLRSHGTSAHRRGARPRATYAYDDTAQLVPSDMVAGTTNGPAGRDNGDLSAFERSQVAANTGSRLAEASSSAFRAADNVGGFTVSAKHLPGAGGRWNKWAEGADINGTIANALRSDGATFLPNAGGAADSFIVRTNVGSVIGTKGQTYVKAVISNDGRIITAYPVK